MRLDDERVRQPSLATLAEAAKGAVLGYSRPGERVLAHFLQKRLVEVRNEVAGG